MSVIGIDFGNESVYIAVARAGGIETIANDYSLRATPSVVTFTENQRVMGVAAKNMLVSHNKNTVTNFKKLLGKKFKEPVAQRELQQYLMSASAGEMPDGTVGFRVQYANQDKAFTPEQITAMLFTKLRDVTEMAIGVRIQDCVISVPAYFTDSERHAVLDAASLAGLNPLRLLNDTAAVGLAYGITKQDLPAPEEQPRYVFFVDVGQSSTQIAGIAFHKGKLKVLSTVADACLGGRDFDARLVDYFTNEIRQSYRLDAASSRRAMLRLAAEVEKLKKQMSANTSELPLNIECFMEDRDVRSKMKRATFEQLCEPLFQRIEQMMVRCLAESQLELAKIHSVEVVGGSTRIPAVKALIQKVFGLTPSTTLNQDEAVARGCALMCATLSPAFKVRDFSVSDVQLYPVHLRWATPAGEKGDMEIFPARHAVPFVKVLSLYRSEPFYVEAYYGGKNSVMPLEDKSIGVFQITNVPPANASGEPYKVKVKAKVNSHGIFTVSSATLVEKIEVAEEPMDTAPAAPANGETDGAAGQPPKAEEAAPPPGDEATPPEEGGEKKEGSNDAPPAPAPAKKKTRTIDLQVEGKVHRMRQEVYNAFHEEELSMISADRHERERMDARNAVEEYTYEMRGKLSEVFSPFVSEPEKEKFTGFLQQTEDWLYEEGENCMKSLYTERLAELKKLGDPVVHRFTEFESRGPAIEEFARALQQSMKFVDAWKSGDESVSHIDQESIEKVEKTAVEKWEWLDARRGQLQSVQRHQDPPVLTAQIKSEFQAFKKVVEPIMRKPKPKPKVEEPPPTAPPPTNPENPPAPQDSAPSQENMDLD